MSKVTNKFRKNSGIYIECRYSKNDEPYRLIEPEGEPLDGIPELNDFDRLLLLKAIKNNKTKPSRIKKISCQNDDKYKPTRRYFFHNWTIGARLKKKSRGGVDPLQTNVNVEIGPIFSIIGFLGRFINLLFKR